LSGASGPANAVASAAVTGTGLTVAGADALSGFWTGADLGAGRPTTCGVLTVRCALICAVFVDGNS
jgi:hypothetical protein